MQETSRRNGLNNRKAIFVALLCFLFMHIENRVNGQVQATGHVFAEIVEPTGLSAKANNNHFITGNSDNSIGDFLLAEIKLTGPALNIGVSVQTDKLIAANGETLLLNAIATPVTPHSGTTPSISELYNLHGTPEAITRARKKTTYNGQYRVTFMYD